MKKKVFVILFFFTMIITQNIFAYNYLTHIRNWRGETI